MTLEQLAKEANGYLYRERVPHDRVLSKDDAPEWFTQMCHAAHGPFMPNDWSYEFIQDALNALENGDEDAPDLDSLYPYTSDRLDWFASHLERHTYCDEAAADYGMPNNVLALVALGMQRELEEVFASVRESLNRRLEEDQE